jgi:hypothetical protein
MTMTPEPFVTAEIAYRLERAQKQYPHPKGRRHRVPRRRTLRLPQSRPRPLSVA